MSKILIVTYDLAEPGRNYEDLLKRITGYSSWARLGGSSYLIETNQSAIDVRDYLVEVTDSNDQIFVSVARAPAAWNGLSEEVSNWINNKLG